VSEVLRSGEEMKSLPYWFIVVLTCVAVSCADGGGEVKTAAHHSSTFDKSGQYDVDLLERALATITRRLPRRSAIDSFSDNPCLFPGDAVEAWARPHGLDDRETNALGNHQERNRNPAELPQFRSDVVGSLSSTSSDEPIASLKPALLTFSMPGYDGSGSVAIICAGGSWAEFGGEWYLLVFEHKDSEWSLVKQLVTTQY